ncbi:MAG: plastocyanin/azurin family copper-binding protein [Bauldia sp.]
MILSRRHILRTGGLALAGLSLPAWTAEGGIDIRMRGDAVGADVWFDPVGFLVGPGATVRWRNDDAGNSHTTTAYHPDNRGHPLRIPEGAVPWNSDYLLPGETFAVTFAKPGVYDYFCIPHEMAGMVGRIVVAEAGGAAPVAVDDGDAVHAFPPVADILHRGAVHRA